MRIRLLVFGKLSDHVDPETKGLEVPDGATTEDLRRTLSERHPDARRALETAMVAVNQSYIPSEQSLRDGDVVAFMPPVSGG